MSIDEPFDAAARAIFWTQNNVMHDHMKLWRECQNKKLYRESAEAALRAYRRAEREDELRGQK